MTSETDCNVCSGLVWWIPVMELSGRVSDPRSNHRSLTESGGAEVTVPWVSTVHSTVQYIRSILLLCSRR